MHVLLLGLRKLVWTLAVAWQRVRTIQRNKKVVPNALPIVRSESWSFIDRKMGEMAHKKVEKSSCAMPNPPGKSKQV
jgi:hypothetical protein